MRVLVLGAGALGGYIGGRALERGLDVAFLVRPRRAAQLAALGLRVESPFGDITRPVRTVAEAAPGADVVLLGAKAYDLDAAIAAIRPAVEAGAAVLPVLNGLAHMERLEAAFGRERLWGGLARIIVALGADGVIRHSGWTDLVCGEQDGRMDGRAAAFARALGTGPGLVATAVPDIAQQMWDKMVTIATMGGANVLFRAAIGDIIRAGGGPLVTRLLEGNAAIAAAHGHPVSPATMALLRRAALDPESTVVASLLRDVEGGGPTEADHVLGWMAEAAERVGLPADLQRAAWVHARAQAERRARGG
jgi:2-dehydropantoate 2-reductase